MRNYTILATLLVTAVILRAQEYRATVLGTVTDSAGAAVPNAAIVATNN